MRLLAVFTALLFCLAALPAHAEMRPAVKTAIFAGGNFWHTQRVFALVPGVTNTVAGYTGGMTVNPGYRQVAAGAGGHRMAVLVSYDPARVSYAQLLGVFWRSIDPVDGEGQFCDRGFAYSTGIFYADAAQKAAAEESEMLIEADAMRLGGRDVATAILKAGPFYAAESHHQSYYLKNPLRFKFYASRCGGEARLKALWGAW